MLSTSIISRFADLSIHLCTIHYRQKIAKKIRIDGERCHHKYDDKLCTLLYDKNMVMIGMEIRALQILCTKTYEARKQFNKLQIAWLYKRLKFTKTNLEVEFFGSRKITMLLSFETFDYVNIVFAVSMIGSGTNWQWKDHISAHHGDGNTWQLMENTLSAKNAQSLVDFIMQVWNRLTFFKLRPCMTFVYFFKR